MKYLFCFLFFTCSLLTFSQETEEVPFAIIEDVPVYKGCDESMSSKDLKKCMSSSISNVVAKNFNVKLAKKLNLPDGKVKIMATFKVGEKGEIRDIKVKAPHRKLEKETIRVLKLIPDLEKPGYLRGKPVIVPYALPIIFNVQN